MPNIDRANKWLTIVAEDFVVAEDLYKLGHWLYTGFMCHQVIEKGGGRETTECLVEGTRSNPTGACAATMTRPTSTTTSV